MANISTSGAMSGKDFVTKEGPVETEDFNFLFNYCIDNLRKLNQINDETSFRIELNKIRKRMKKRCRYSAKLGTNGRIAREHGKKPLLKKRSGLVE